MTGTKLAGRYSKSLLLLAVERGEVEQVFSDMKHVVNICSRNHDLVMLLRSPIIKTDKKKTILREIFAEEIGQTSMAFIEIIATKRREMYLKKIAEEFTHQYKENKNIATATVTTTILLDENLKAKILAFAKDKTKQEVELIEKTDEKLIGGFILRIGDEQMDASIHRKLNDLKRSFSENPYIKDF